CSEDCYLDNPDSLWVCCRSSRAWPGRKSCAARWQTTGSNFFGFEVASKQFGLLHELVPKASRIAVLVNPSTGVAIDITLRAVREAARALALEVTVLKAKTPAEIDAAFEALAHERADALFIQADGFFASRRVQI